MWKEVITLRAETPARDSFGGSAPVPVDTEVFANKKSVSRSEFYSASMAGEKIDNVYQVRSEDYDNQTEVLDGTVVYKIVRTYQKGEGIVELMCAVREVS